WYFIHFLVILPLLGFLETPRPLPNSISEAVLKKGKVPATVMVLLSAIFAGLVATSTKAAAEDEVLPPHLNWSFAGPFGRYDRGQLQRGFKVYREVCQNCHGLKLVSFHSLGGREGLGYSEEQVKAIAAEYKVTDGPNDQGEMFQRPGRP